MGWQGGRVDWSLGIQRCKCEFESHWLRVRSVIISETILRSFLTAGLLPFPQPIKELQRSNSKLVTSCGGRL